MHSIKISHGGQRLYIRLTGFFDLTAANNVIFEIRNLSHRLKPGFTVISTIKDIQPANNYVQQKIGEADQLLITLGVQNIIRVVGGSKYALTVFAKNSTKVVLKGQIYYVPTIKMAEEKAEELECSSALA